MTFSGIPHDAITFYRELELNNSREWWQANKQRYDEVVRGPFEQLAGMLEPVFGEPKVFRPHRDVRFSHDKSPYKRHQGLFVPTMPRAGWYFQVDAEGIRMGGGSYHFDGEQLAGYRAAVAEDVHGRRLERLVNELVDAGYELGGEQLATRPRGVAADAPRLDLLRRKALNAMLVLGEPDWMATAELAEYVHDCWDEVRPLVDWLRDCVG
ncbi:DUF2461 domain-containing protein [Propionibacteriaceae bacterium Y1923]